MKLITKNSDYAIRAIIHLVKNKGSIVSVRDISESERIPFAYLRRILQTLVKENIVESKEGSGGGLKLKRDVQHLNIMEIIQIFQGDVELTDCLFRKKICFNRKNCALRQRLKSVEDKVKNEFKKITIGDLLRGARMAYGKKKNY